MKTAQKVAWNTIIQFGSKIISIILGLFTIAFMTRYLGQNGFGEYTTINTFISFFAVAADLGLTLVTVQMISQPGIKRDEVLSNLFSLRFYTALGLLVLAPITILFFPYSASVKIGVLITFSSYFFVALNQILVGLFQKELRLDKVAIADVVSRAALLLGVIAASIFGWGLYGILWVSVFSSVLSFAIHFAYAKRFARISLNINWQIWVEIIKKAWPIGLTIVFNLIYLRADTLILSIFKSQNEVGIYGAAYKVIDVLITLPFIFAGIVLPLMTKAWSEKDEKRFNNIIQKSFDLMSIIAIPMIFGAYFLADSIMSTVAGPEFTVAGSVLRILIVAASTIYLGTVFSHAVIAIDKQRAIIGAYIFVAITALAGYLVFIPKYSYFGAAWMTIYSETAIALASLFLVWRHSRFLPSLAVMFKSLIAAVAMSFVLYLIPAWPMPLAIITGGLVYTASLFIVRGITKNDIWELMAKS